jgi:hypothetical protein
MKQNSCHCLESPSEKLVLVRSLRSDVHFADISHMYCPECGRAWLRYLYELEAFTGSSRWYLGALTEEQLAALSSENARATFGRLEWYYYGGSYFNGLTGKTRGELVL